MHFYTVSALNKFLDLNDASSSLYSLKKTVNEDESETEGSDDDESTDEADEEYNEDDEDDEEENGFVAL